MAQEFAKSFYTSKQWQKCRESFIAKRRAIDGGMCQECGENLGYIVHHKIALTPYNISDPDISLNHSRLKYVWIRDIVRSKSYLMMNNVS